jgi:hypothetical protein
VIRGWLLLLALLLLVWEPIALGLLASSIFSRLVDRPAAIAVLGFRLLATAMGLAAGLALLSRRPHAVRLAKTALVLSALTGLLVYLTPWFPRNHPASLSWTLAGLSLAYSAGWLVYLTSSSQARDIARGQTRPSPGLVVGRSDDSPAGPSGGGVSR